MNKVLLLTGPGGSGKTTISELLVSKYGWARVDGDQLDTEFFPHNGQWLPENTEKLAVAHDKIIREAR
jgi:adenylate kinase family enzyme